MSSPVARFHVEKFAGYQSLEWEGIDSKVNLLVGQNGVGKTLLLEGLIVSLNYLSGQHTRDLISRSNPDSIFELQFANSPRTQRFSGQDVRSIQGGRNTGWTCQILHVVENRQPKNTVGREGSPHRRNPIMRYANTAAHLKALATSVGPEGRAIADETFDLCRRFPGAVLPNEWDWIRAELLRRGPKALRPSSCGQYDLLAIVLDVVTFRHDATSRFEPHYVILDNPETYLHPACLRPLLNLIREQLPDAQLFVATHSTKLLTYARPQSVFWLTREARDSGDVRLGSIRALSHGARAAFVELYGEDVDPGLFSMLGELESPEAHRFLAECALECYARPRRDPGNDAQIQLVVEAIPRGVLTLLDFGAGHGDLLGALADANYLHPDLLYVAIDPDPPRLLQQRLIGLVAQGRIRKDSRVVTGIEEAPALCEVVTLLNVVHHLSIPELAQVLHELLANHLARRLEARLLISELRTLAEGERGFILWTGQDFLNILADVRSVEVIHQVHEGRHRFEAIDATIVRWRSETDCVFLSADELEERLWRQLTAKREMLLDELAGLQLCGDEDGLERRWRQHRVAFLCAQVAWLCAAERKHVVEGNLPGR